MASLTDANNHATSFAYDRFDRLATTTYPAGSIGGITTEVLTYDADSNVTSRKTRAGDTISFAYDTLNRLCTKTIAASPTACAAASSASPTVWYGHDLAGRLTSTADNSAAIVAAVPPSGPSVPYAMTYGYDVLNRPTNATWSPAAVAAAPTAGNVTFTHTYNRANQRIGQSVSDNSWLTYPAATPGTVNYTADALNRYTAVGAVSPSYDGNSNLTSDGTFTLGYDAENRLVSASGAGNSVAYSYDAQGRRKSKTVNGVTTVFVTDAGNREVLEYDGASGAIQRWYAYGLGSNEVLNQSNVAAGTRAALIPDIQGSVIAALDSGSGALTRTGYLPYGRSAAAPAPFGYTGQRGDPETGLYYYRARHYSPAWGRFLQTDPIGVAGGGHLYAYVGNDPLNNVDPQGLWGFGLQASASVEGGVILAGVGATGSLGGGIFGGGSQGLNVGGYASGGAFAGGPGYGASYPAVQPGGTTAVAGAAAGGGGGIFFTNATSAAELGGPFNTYSLNTPIGSIQLGKSGSTWIFSVTCGVPPCGIGTPTVAASTYPTNTKATPPK